MKKQVDNCKKDNESFFNGFIYGFYFEIIILIIMLLSKMFIKDTNNLNGSWFSIIGIILIVEVLAVCFLILFSCLFWKKVIKHKQVNIGLRFWIGNIVGVFTSFIVAILFQFANEVDYVLFTIYMLGSFIPLFIKIIIDVIGTIICRKRNNME